MYNALSLAKYILSYYTQRGTPISNLRLQYILYLMWEAYSAAGKGHLFETSMFYARACGPVVADVHSQYCMHGGFPINERSDERLNESDEVCLIPILEDCAALHLSDLHDRVCEGDSPWSHVYHAEGNVPIPFSMIEKAAKRPAKDTPKETCVSIDCPFIFCCKAYDLSVDRREGCETQKKILATAKEVELKKMARKHATRFAKPSKNERSKKINQRKGGGLCD